MEALKAFEFGNLIAFILPGLVATRAVAYYHPSVKTALDAVTRGGDGSVGPLVFLFLMAATVGLTISVVRQRWVDPASSLLYQSLPSDGPTGAVRRHLSTARRCWRQSTLMAAFPAMGRGWLEEIRSSRRDRQRPPASPNYAVLAANEKAMQQFEKAIANVYRYYQFAGNMSVAIALLASARWHQGSKLVDAMTPSTMLVSDADTERQITRGLFGLATFLVVTAYFQYKGWCSVHNQISTAFAQGKSGTPSGPESAPGTTP